MNETFTTINSSIQSTVELTVLEKTKELVNYITQKEVTKIEYMGSDHDSNVLADFIRTLQYQYKLHTLLTPRALYSLAETIFNNEHIRDFILGGSDELAILLSENPDDIGNLIITIVNGLSKNRQNKQGLSLIPGPIFDTTNVESNVITNTLNDNFWIVFVIALYLFTPVGP